jgi:hypothetical protein
LTMGDVSLTTITEATSVTGAPFPEES